MTLLDEAMVAHLAEVILIGGAPSEYNTITLIVPDGDGELVYDDCMPTQEQIEAARVVADNVRKHGADGWRMSPLLSL